MDIKRRFIDRLVDRARRDPGWMKKVFMISGAALLCFLVTAGLLIVMAINGLKDVVSVKPDTDLIALRELLLSKVLILTDDQQAQMLPLVKRLGEETLPVADKAEVKKQLYGLLDQNQRDRVHAWMAEVARKSDKVDSLPQQFMAAVERYTGFSMKSISLWTDALSAWWKTKKPEDSAGRLAEELSRPKAETVNKTPHRAE